MDSAEINGVGSDNAVGFLRRQLRRVIKVHGPNSSRALRMRGMIASVHADQDEYVESLIAHLDVYWRKVKTLGLKHTATIDTRFCIMELLRKHGTVEVVSGILPKARRTFKRLVAIIRNTYQQGLYEKSLNEGLDIMHDMTTLLDYDHPITMKMGSLIAEIYASTEEYDHALEIIDGIYQTKKEQLGQWDRRTATTLMKKASILLKMCRLQEALNYYIEARAIRNTILGVRHRKTMIATRCVAEASYILGSFHPASFMLKRVAHFQKKHKFRESLITDMHIGNLEFLKGNYKQALAIFNEAIKAKKAPVFMRAMLLKLKGATLIALHRYFVAGHSFHLAYRLLSSTHFYAETLSILQDLALVLAKEEMFATSHAVLDTLIEAAELVLKGDHSVTLSIEKDLGVLYSTTGRYEEALAIFIKLVKFQRNTTSCSHPAVSSVKCEVAKMCTKQGKYEEALKIYNEVLMVYKANFYPQHPDLLLVKISVASIYESRGFLSEAFQKYYETYEIILKSYGKKHTYTKQITDTMQAVTEHMPLSRLIDAVTEDRLEDVITYVIEGDDVNARDINGAVALHYASRGVNADIVKCLLNNGAIYDIKDMGGYTAADFAIDSTTKFVFLVADRLFECVKKGNFELSKKIIRRDSWIVNARDSDSRTPLQHAVDRGFIPIVIELLANGADVSLLSEDGTALHIAANSGRAEITDVLLGHMLAMNSGSFRGFIDSRDNVMSQTAMHIAASNNDVNCVNVLMKYKANPLIRDAYGKFSYDLGCDEMKQHIMMYTARYLNVVSTS